MLRKDAPVQRKFLSGAIQRDGVSLGERQIRVIASDATPDRVKDVMVPEGCEATHYAKNPIVLADHDPSKPIGTAAIEITNGRVEALISFAPAGLSAKADEYCGLAKAGVLNSVSVGFQPLVAEPIKGGGWRIEKWELMEVSLVAVPANPSALVISRSLDVATMRKAEATWKVAASRNLPLAKAESWDAAVAKAAIFAKAGFDDDDPDVSPDISWARKAFLVYDASAPKLKGSYKLPFAEVVNGRLTANPHGLAAAAARLEATDVPDEVKVRAREVIDAYHAKDGAEKCNGVLKAQKSAAPALKGLYDVARLAHLLADLGCIQDAASYEAQYESDGSKVPAMLASALRDLADALIAMTAEESAELLAGRDVEIERPSHDMMLSGDARAKHIRAIFAKAGRAISAANADKLDKAMACLDKAADLGQDLPDMQAHLAEAAKHVKSVRGTGAEDTDAPGNTSQDPDGELNVCAARRKRMLRVLEIECSL